MIATEFDCVSEDNSCNKIPVRLLKEENYDLWFLKDDHFKKPKIRVGMKLYTDDCNFGKSVKGRAFTSLWNGVLGKYLKEFFYMAEMAGMSFSHVFAHDNMQFIWSGFSQKISNFINETIQ